MNKIEKERFRKIFADKIKRETAGMTAGMSRELEDLTFVYDIPFNEKCVYDKSEDKCLQAEFWIIFKFDIREPSGCRVIIEKHWLHATKSEHLLTFSIDCKDIDLPENIQYIDHVEKIVQCIQEAYDLAITKSSYL